MIYKNKLRRLVREAVRDLQFASRGSDGYEFSAVPPKKSDQLYGKDIAETFQDVEYVKDFFKNSIVDVNIIVLPDRVYASVLKSFLIAMGVNSYELFASNLDGNLFSKVAANISAKVRGLRKELSQVRKLIDSEAINIIVQNQEREEANAFLFDLSYLAHDMLGHSINFQYDNTLLNIAHNLTNILTLGKVKLDDLAVGSTFEQELQVATPTLPFDPQQNKKIVDAIIADFERSNFGAGVGDFDLGANIIAFYAVTGDFPKSINDLVTEGVITEDFLQDIAGQINNRLDKLKGTVAFTNFGDVKSPLRENFTLHEFRKSPAYLNKNFNGMISANTPPPSFPDESSNGGRGSCPPQKMSIYYDKVFDTFPAWVETNFPLTKQEEKRNNLFYKKQPEDYHLIITEYDKYLKYLHNNYEEFSMSLVSEDYNEFFELIMTIIAAFACKRNISDLAKIYINPMAAIKSF